MTNVDNPTEKVHQKIILRCPAANVLQYENMETGNIHLSLPIDLKTEVFEDIVHAPGVRIERIVSLGHTSPESGWYDQDENEWVMVIQGGGEITFEDGAVCKLSKGDYLTIPAGRKHRVSWTDPDQITLWLAVFYK